MKDVMPIAAFLLASSAAFADEVQLANGRTLQGIARREPGRVVVETRWGTLGLPESEVLAIVPGRSPLHEYQERLARLGPHPDAAQVFELATWAQREGLIRYVNPLFQRTIAIDPGHAEARRYLGFITYEGEWMTPREREDRQTRAEPRKNVELRRAPRPRPLPEMSPGYVYLGIPPPIPRRGSQNQEYGYSPVVWEGLVLTFGRPMPRMMR